MTAPTAPTARDDATPRPWQLGTVAIVDREHGGYLEAPENAVIYCGDGEDENEIHIEGPDALANAVLIVCAVNAYDDLVAALTALVRERSANVSDEKLALIASGAPLPRTEGYAGLGQREASIIQQARAALSRTQESVP